MNTPPTRPSVTVILPVYNGSAYLQEALDSIFAQTFQDYELLVIDDGSTDHTPEILQSVSDPRLRVVTHQTNEGLVATLNEALEIGLGEFFARQDADDLSHPERLQKQVDFLRAHLDCVLVGTEAIQMDARGRKAFRLWRPDNPESVRWYLCFDNPFIHSSVLFRRATIWRDFGGYVKPCFPAEDYALWSRVARERKMTNLPEPLLRYREHAGSAWGALSPKGMTAMEEITHGIRLENIRALLGEETYSRHTIELEDCAWTYSTYRREFSVKSGEAFLTALERLVAIHFQCANPREWNVPKEFRRVFAIQYAELAYRFLPVARWKALGLLRRAHSLSPEIITGMPWLRMAALFVIGEAARNLVRTVRGD